MVPISVNFPITCSASPAKIFGDILVFSLFHVFHIQPISPPHRSTFKIDFKSNYVLLPVIVNP